MRSLLILLLLSSAASGDTLFVSCEDEGKIAVVDAQNGKLVDLWPAGKRPRGLQLTRGGTRLYVALSGSPKAGPGVDQASLPPADRDADGIGEFDAHSG